MDSAREVKHKQPARNWVSESRFSLLVDYYPEVQFRPYGSGATRANVLPVLRELKPGYLCIYAKGHSGYTTWPSSLRTQHNRLAQDMPKLFRAVTREANVKLVLYYSGLLDGIAGQRYPDWRMKHLDGKDALYFNGFEFFKCYGLCPLSGYWDEWVSIQLRELIENYDPDGIWVDGDWAGPCYCPRCQERFRKEAGGRQTWTETQQRSDFAAAYARFWSRITHEWRTRFCRFVKSLKPDCLYSAGNVSPRREFLAPFDWRSGDFFSPGFFNLHDMARMMRWYGTLGVPYDAYICDTSFTHGRPHVRSRSKTLDRMKQEAATVAANGGAIGYWTYPTGHGALVPSRMKKAVAVRRFIEEREEIFRQTDSVHWTAIMVSDPSSPTFGSPNIEGAHKALAALHRSPAIMDETGFTAGASCDLIVLPEQPYLEAATAARLAAFVRHGGKLLTSGATIHSPAIQKLLGVKAVRCKAVNDGHVLLKSCDEPTGVDSAWDKLELAGATELYPLYLSWDQFNPELRCLRNNWPMHGQVDEEHPEPAGFSAAVARRIGKGRVVHIATDIFSRYATLGDPQMLRWIREIVDHLQPRPLFRTDAPSWVDVSLRCQGDRLLIHLVNQNPGRDVAKLHTDDLWVDEIPAIGPITVWIRTVTKPRKVTWEPAHKPLDWHIERGVLCTTVPRLEIHGAVVLSPGRRT